MQGVKQTGAAVAQHVATTIIASAGSHADVPLAGPVGPHRRRAPGWAERTTAGVAVGGLPAAEACVPQWLIGVASSGSHLRKQAVGPTCTATCTATCRAVGIALGLDCCTSPCVHVGRSQCSTLWWLNVRSASEQLARAQMGARCVRRCRPVGLLACQRFVMQATVLMDGPNVRQLRRLVSLLPCCTMFSLKVAALANHCACDSAGGLRCLQLGLYDLQLASELVKQASIASFYHLVSVSAAGQSGRTRGTQAGRRGSYLIDLRVRHKGGQLSAQLYSNLQCSVLIPVQCTLPSKLVASLRFAEGRLLAGKRISLTSRLAYCSMGGLVAVPWRCSLSAFQMRAAHVLVCGPTKSASLRGLARGLAGALGGLLHGAENALHKGKRAILMARHTYALQECTSWALVRGTPSGRPGHHNGFKSRSTSAAYCINRLVGPPVRLRAAELSCRGVDGLAGPLASDDAGLRA